MRIHRIVDRLPVAATLAALTLGAACSSGDSTGNLTINYRFGPGLSCAEEGVSSIRVELCRRGTVCDGNPTGDPTIDEPVYTLEQACDADTPLPLSAVPSGAFELLVAGLDSEGDMIRDNLGSDTTRVEIVGGTNAETNPISLQPTPARIEFLWTITEDGRAAQCEFSTAKAFLVEVFRVSQSLASHRFDYCEQPPQGSPLPDEGRDIDGDLVDGVTVSVLDEGGAAFSTVDARFTPPGAGKTVQLEVSCDGQQCGIEVLSGAASTDEGDDAGADESGGGESGSSDSGTGS